MPIITLITDFGQQDAFVASMKGVILGIAPQATIVDVGHHVPPQDVTAAALLLEAAAPCFPAGTIHVAVVDPGVGSQRAAVAVQTTRGIFIGPDNGLFSLVLADEAAPPPEASVRLTDPAYHRQPVSDTFHGRDIFAPVAAHLATGVALVRLGPPHGPLKTLALPQPQVRSSGIEAQVIHVDQFGNLVTNVRREDLTRWRPADALTRPRILVGSARLTGIARTYADVPPGKPVAYLGSTNRLEVAIRNGNAARTWGARRGTMVQIV